MVALVELASAPKLPAKVPPEPLHSSGSASGEHIERWAELVFLSWLDRDCSEKLSRWVAGP